MYLEEWQVGSTSKTLRYAIEDGHRSWYIQTQELYNQVAHFYVAIFADDNHTHLLALSQKEALTEVEKLTVTSITRPVVSYPIEEILGDIPMTMRRACINEAYGIAGAFRTKRQKWEDRIAKKLANGKKFSERPPLLPRVFNCCPTYYSGMQKDFTGDSIMLKLWTGFSWAWVKVALVGQTIPDGWERKSPHTVIKGDRVYLHIPIQKKIKNPGSLEKQVLEEDFGVCSVDLNLGDNQAVCTILDRNGTQVATKFIKGGADLQRRRKRSLGKIATAKGFTGRQSNTSDNRKRWQKLNNIEDYESHRVSKRIVEFALAHSANVIVFEHLGNLKPSKVKYSRRSNQKRAYWLKSKIYLRTKYKAWQHGIITSRVNPRNTSKHCFQCGGEVFRHGEHDVPTGYMVGAPLFTCPNNHRGNADLNAARNVGYKLLVRYNIGKPLSKSSNGWVCLDCK